MTYEKYEKECEKIRKTNEKYLELFHIELKEKGLTKKTIRAHVGNAEFFLNDYNTREEADAMQEGCTKLDDFFGYFFIRKCMWSTPSTIKSTAASLKKFYKCMLEHGNIDKEDYEEVTKTIKENMESWVNDCRQYNNIDQSFFS